MRYGSRVHMEEGPDAPTTERGVPAEEVCAWTGLASSVPLLVPQDY